MKPSSGVKPPMPSMMRSPRSREVMRTLGSVRARALSSTRDSPVRMSGLSPEPPCGATRATRLFSEPLFAQLDEAQLARRQVGNDDRHAAAVAGDDGEVRRSFEPLGELLDAAAVAPVRESAVVPVGEEQRPVAKLVDPVEAAEGLG